MKPNAIDILANAIRQNPKNIAAGVLAERYLLALHAAGYLVKEREPKPPTHDLSDPDVQRRLQEHYCE